MGLLDHSTNNIILDAVLTDYGRQQLAMANGKDNFQITYYALADDEVDYGLIKKYGRAVGKEKIEKNTPIFEALTNPGIALKYRLIGKENTGTTIATTYLPVLTTDTTISLRPNASAIKVTVQMKFNNSTVNIPAELKQKSYTIKVPDRFFSISGAVGGTLTNASKASAAVDPGDPNRVATYSYVLNKTADSISFDITPKKVDNTILTVYGKRTGTTNERTINSHITVIGDNHGCTLHIPATYTATLTV